MRKAGALFNSLALPFRGLFNWEELAASGRDAAVWCQLWLYTAGIGILLSFLKIPEFGSIFDGIAKLAFIGFLLCRLIIVEQECRKLRATVQRLMGMRDILELRIIEDQQRLNRLESDGEQQRILWETQTALNADVRLELNSLLDRSE